MTSTAHASRHWCRNVSSADARARSLSQVATRGGRLGAHHAAAPRTALLGERVYRACAHHQRLLRHPGRQLEYVGGIYGPVLARPARFRRAGRLRLGATRLSLARAAVAQYSHGRPGSRRGRTAPGIARAAHALDLSVDCDLGVRGDASHLPGSRLRVYPRRSGAQRALALWPRATDRVLLYVSRRSGGVAHHRLCALEVADRLLYAGGARRSSARAIAGDRYDARQTLRLCRLQRRGWPGRRALCPLRPDVDAVD